MPGPVAEPQSKEDKPIPNKNKTTVKTRLNDALGGVQANLTGNVTLTGVAYAPVALAGVFSSALTALQQADELHTQWSAQVKAAQLAVTQALKVRGQLQQYLTNVTPAPDLPNVLAKYGMTERKVRVLTPAEKAAAAVKAKATRALRGTKSAKQKQAIKSNVQVTIAAEPAAAAPAPTTPSPALPAKTGA